MSRGWGKGLKGRLGYGCRTRAHTLALAHPPPTHPLHPPALTPQAKLEAGQTATVSNCDGQTFEIKAGMVEIKKVTEKVTGKTYTPSVIEPSFGIGRIMYCMFEHCYYTREVGARWQGGRGLQKLVQGWGGGVQRAGKAPSAFHRLGRILSRRHGANGLLAKRAIRYGG